MEIAQNITVDPAIHHGTPIITGTRVPISLIIGSLAGGMSKEEVMQEYELTKTQVEAALSYATDWLNYSNDSQKLISAFLKLIGNLSNLY